MRTIELGRAVEVESFQYFFRRTKPACKVRAPSFFFCRRATSCCNSMASDSVLHVARRRLASRLIQASQARQTSKVVWVSCSVPDRISYAQCRRRELRSPPKRPPERLRGGSRGWLSSPLSRTALIGAVFRACESERAFAGRGSPAFLRNRKMPWAPRIHKRLVVKQRQPTTVHSRTRLTCRHPRLFTRFKKTWHP
jgi:hypothetical protein